MASVAVAVIMMIIMVDVDCTTPVAPFIFVAAEIETHRAFANVYAVKEVDLEFLFSNSINTCLNRTLPYSLFLYVLRESSFLGCLILQGNALKCETLLMLI